MIASNCYLINRVRDTSYGGPNMFPTNYFSDVFLCYSFRKRRQFHLPVKIHKTRNIILSLTLICYMYLDLLLYCCALPICQPCTDWSRFTYKAVSLWAEGWRWCLYQESVDRGSIMRQEDKAGGMDLDARSLQSIYIGEDTGLDGKYEVSLSTRQLWQIYCSTSYW